ncbi:glycoside hydrolase domain-containing protein [Streptomyces sp. NPDC059786]|uniref:glycoside hydrolase domain-containing protein n=1 Tax=Streptomyces sp. NPDC059786 TaxID=3346946 RepID=UPI00364A1F52
MDRHTRHPSHHGHGRQEPGDRPDRRRHRDRRRGRPTAFAALSLTLLLLSLAGAPASGTERYGPGGPDPFGPGAEAEAFGSFDSFGSLSDEVGRGLEHAVSPMDGYEDGDEDGYEGEGGYGDGHEGGYGDEPGREQELTPGQGQAPEQGGQAPDEDQGRAETEGQAQSPSREHDQSRSPEQGQSPAGVPERPQRVGAAVRFRGRAFDTCHTPSADTMRKWLASRYRAVGVYFGGRGRACPNQPRLTSAWLRTVDELGWNVLPLYVGSQASCVFSDSKKHVSIGKKPWERGQQEAADAVRRAQALGIEPGSPLYLDMEAYNYRNKKCARTTLKFVRGWNREVRSYGYVPGFYSSAETGVRHMENARRAGTRDLPTVMWFARWRGKPALTKEPVLRPGSWSGGRIHQYAGNVKERHGGRTLVIDRSVVDAPVARIG